MADFKHHRFSLRCFNKDIIPVSIRLKSSIRTPRSLNILKKAERALLDERIRTINDTLEMLEHQRNTCMNKLSRVLDQKVMDESQVFINRTKKARHFKTLEWQKAEFERLGMRSKGTKGGHSNDQNMNIYMYDSGKNLNSRQTATTTTAPAAMFKWVINMSSTPLTEAQKVVGPWTKFCYIPNKTAHRGLHSSS